MENHGSCIDVCKTKRNGEAVDFRSLEGDPGGYSNRAKGSNEQS